LGEVNPPRTGEGKERTADYPVPGNAPEDGKGSDESRERKWERKREKSSAGKVAASSRRAVCKGGYGTDRGSGWGVCRENDLQVQHLPGGRGPERAGERSRKTKKQTIRVIRMEIAEPNSGSSL